MFSFAGLVGEMEVVELPSLLEQLTAEVDFGEMLRVESLPVLEELTVD